MEQKNTDSTKCNIETIVQNLYQKVSVKDKNIDQEKNQLESYYKEQQKSTFMEIVKHYNSNLPQEQQQAEISDKDYKITYLDEEKNIANISYNANIIDTTMNLSVYFLSKYWLSGQQMVTISADQQTQGRGQQSNKWASPQGNCYATFNFMIPPQNFAKIALSLVYSCATLDTIDEFTPEKKTNLKWTNDLFISDKKVGGLLVVCESDGMVSLGIGVNLNTLPQVPGATCLKDEIGKECNVSEFIEKLGKNVFKYTQLLDKDPKKIHQTVKGRLQYFGQKVNIFSPTDMKMESIQHTGVFADINDFGMALLKQEDGCLKTISEGRMRPVE